MVKISLCDVPRATIDIRHGTTKEDEEELMEEQATFFIFYY